MAQWLEAVTLKWDGQGSTPGSAIYSLGEIFIIDLREREGETSFGCFPHAMGNPGLCPDGNQTHQFLVHKMMLQPTEPHLSGPWADFPNLSKPYYTQLYRYYSNNHVMDFL